MRGIQTLVRTFKQTSTKFPLDAQAVIDRWITVIQGSMVVLAKHDDEASVEDINEALFVLKLLVDKHHDELPKDTRDALVECIEEVCETRWIR